MYIIFIEGSRPSPDNFGAFVHLDTLHLPFEFKQVLEYTQVHSAEELVCYLQTYPTHFIQSLNCTQDQFFSARAKLFQQLTGLIADEFLNPPNYPQMSYGALRPDRSSTDGQ